MSKKRLLVIEDDVDLAEMLVVYFIAQGYDVLNAISGAEGVAMARSRFPNLILLDVMLPDMDGFDVCRALRTTTLSKHIPIIFLTQRDARADKVAGLELGADDYITKPFDVEELRLRVQGSIRRSNRESLHDPRSGLPTNVLIQDTRDALMQRPNFTPLNIQLAGFRAFHDLYGFMAGDEALAFTGQVFMETIAQIGTADDFAGTLSDDSFVIFTFVPDVKPFIDTLGQHFNEGIKRFYNFVDSERGYSLVNAGMPDEKQVPLMHLLVSLVGEGMAIS